MSFRNTVQRALTLNPSRRAAAISSQLSRSNIRNMASVPSTMKGVTIEKTGGPEVLQYKTDLPVPEPKGTCKRTHPRIDYMYTLTSSRGASPRQERLCRHQLYRYLLPQRPLPGSLFPIHPWSRSRRNSRKSWEWRHPRTPEWRQGGMDGGRSIRRIHSGTCLQDD